MYRIGQITAIATTVIALACAAPEKFADDFDALRRLIAEAQIYGKPSTNSFMVTVIGAVKKPGIYHLPAGTTLQNCVRDAQPITSAEHPKWAVMKKVYVFTGSAQTPTIYDVKTMLAEPDKYKIVPSSGSTIYVPFCAGL